MFAATLIATQNWKTHFNVALTRASHTSHLAIRERAKKIGETNAHAHTEIPIQWKIVLRFTNTLTSGP